ncbi:recombinase family protein [Mesorhizobium sp. B4-1-4]|uniref:recombinase family protein n=1 Tax=Mesorhizobium sp. B4-1-4 TaxID=2589888 RepID=UPI001126E804|nr:recombinase family protein [Mesorhizobium sp. B4-1-4]UCI29432.1 recombinase family protein [Mesorhizobium sp. B4-1-4]
MDHLAASPRFVSYLRVSTLKQGALGLGIAAQREAVQSYVRGAGAGGTILTEYVETESGKRNDRPQLHAAIEHCKLAGARLVIAKLDRLSRNAAFMIGLRDAGVDFVAADMPQADSFTVGILALVAEREREMISQRTKAALAAAKRRGTKLGNPNGAAHLAGLGNVEAVAGIKAKANAAAQRYLKTVASLRADGTTSAQGLARAFNERGFKTPRGSRWNATGVLRLIARLEGKLPAGDPKTA